jgi:segregation and condensation protein A
MAASEAAIYGAALLEPPLMRAAELELDLESFAGPFDLLLALILREELSLAEVELGAIVVAYVEHLERQGELDLEAATEFLVLIASLLELKSRLLLPAPEEDSELRLGPDEAADELLARLLEYHRYREAAAHLARLYGANRDYLYRSAPPPPEVRRASLAEARPSYAPERLAIAIGELLRAPPEPDTSHIRPTVSLERRLAVLRDLLARRAELDFDEAFGGEDRLTQAVTLFALLEMHKRGEATWRQRDIFGKITITPPGRTPEQVERTGGEAAGKVLRAGAERPTEGAS